MAIIAAKLASETQLIENNIPQHSPVKQFSVGMALMPKLALFLIHTVHTVPVFTTEGLREENKPSGPVSP